MSVLIRGMEMPKNCFACACASYYGRIDRAMCDLTNKQLDIKAWKKERHPNCPLVEIPTQHGRLGDLDKLWDRMYNYIDNEGAKMPFGDNDFMIHRDSACELIEDAPTVIESEGEKE